MINKIQVMSHEGHTTLVRGVDLMTDEQVEAKFSELVAGGYRAYGGTTLADYVGPMQYEEAQDYETVLFAPNMAGG